MVHKPLHTIGIIKIVKVLRCKKLQVLLLYYQTPENTKQVIHLGM